MNYSHYALLFLVVLVISVILKKRDIPRGRRRNQADEDNLPDLNRVFLDHSAGRTVVDLVKVFNPSDLMILRSILAAEGIDSYVKSNYFGDLFGSAKESIFSTTVISIFEDKTDDAKSVVHEYVKNLLKDNADPEPELRRTVQTGTSAALGLPAADIKYIPELLV